MKPCKLNEIPQTGFFGWFHHHWTAFTRLCFFALGYLSALIIVVTLYNPTVARYVSHWLHGTPL